MKLDLAERSEGVEGLKPNLAAPKLALAERRERKGGGREGKIEAQLKRSRREGGDKTELREARGRGGDGRRGGGKRERERERERRLNRRWREERHKK